MSNMQLKNENNLKGVLIKELKEGEEGMDKILWLKTIFEPVLHTTYATIPCEDDDGFAI